MTRHLDFGDDRHLALGGIGHDVANLVLGIVAAVGRTVVFARMGVEVADIGFAALRADTRQLGIFPNLDAPTLVVGQMPVEGIDLVGADDVDIGFDLIGREEVAAAIEMGTAVGETRGVFDPHGRDAQLRGFSGRGDEQLFEGLQAPPYALHRAAREDDLFVRGRIERVGLLAQRRVDAQLHEGFALRRSDAQTRVAVLGDPVDEKFGQVAQGVVGGPDRGVLRNVEHAARLLDGDRLGNDVRPGGCAVMYGQTREEQQGCDCDTFHGMGCFRFRGLYTILRLCASKERAGRSLAPRRPEL